MGCLRCKLQPARYGHAPMRLAHRRALSEGIGLPWLCACAAKEECGADLSAHAGQPRAQPGGCARLPRTCRTDRIARDGNCQDQRSLAESGGIERRCGRCHRTGFLKSGNCRLCGMPWETRMDGVKMIHADLVNHAATRSMSVTRCYNSRAERPVILRIRAVSWFAYAAMTS